MCNVSIVNPLHKVRISYRHPQQIVGKTKECSGMGRLKILEFGKKT